jgi:alanine racemase
MDYGHLYSTWVEIDLGAIRSNVSFFCRLTGVRVMAIVKANAYGHGAVPVAHAALEGGAIWLAVARVEEALELRRAGLECPLLLLGLTPPGRYEEAIANQLSITIWEVSQVDGISRAAQRLGVPARVHLKVDTGMSRLGVLPEQALALSRVIASTPRIIYEGLFTHFARADEADPSSADRQEERFRQAIAGLESQGVLPPVVHAANSAAILSRPGAWFNLVRLGISMYGLHPSAERLNPPQVRPALTWKTVLSQVKVLPPGQGVSYGHVYVTRSQERIGVIPVGYADGFRRVLNNQVLVSGQNVPVVGQVCMDQTMLQLDQAPGAHAGDEVVLIGQQGEARITAEDIARRWSTINYEVTCGIGARVPRIYI